MLPSAFTRRVKSGLGPLSDIFSTLDGILKATDSSEKHIATLVLVLQRLLTAGLSVNFTRCIFGAASQESLGMLVNSTGLQPTPSKYAVIAANPSPHSLKELRTFLATTNENLVSICGEGQYSGCASHGHSSQQIFCAQENSEDDCSLER